MDHHRLMCRYFMLHSSHHRQRQQLVWIHHSIGIVVYLHMQQRIYWLPFCFLCQYFVDSIRFVYCAVHWRFCTCDHQCQRCYLSCLHQLW